VPKHQKGSREIGKTRERFSIKPKCEGNTSHDNASKATTKARDEKLSAKKSDSSNA